jgi:hypothetical protein
MGSRSGLISRAIKGDATSGTFTSKVVICLAAAFDIEELPAGIFGMQSLYGPPICCDDSRRRS